ncbi:MAG: hypothetical protein RMM28_02855 [Thermoleophilia bacterium]|nr:hypothetical protein [Gaiellaceae bacterium]MDW8338060.1 hypothetical protein [Thermoleophilia bacterium]
MLALAALYVLAVPAGLLVLDYGPGRAVAWVVVLIGGATLMLVGQRLRRAPALSATLVSAGALLGGFPLLWTIVVPIAVAVVIASSVALARRPSDA